MVQLAEYHEKLTCVWHPYMGGGDGIRKWWGGRAEEVGKFSLPLRLVSFHFHSLKVIFAESLSLASI